MKTSEIMRFVALSSWALALSMFVTCCAADAPDEDAVPSIHAVAGGEPTEGAEEWGGVIGLGAMGYSMCTGTLIDEQVVLTAGHCVKGGGMFDLSMFPQLLSILGGANANITLAKGQRIIVHPTWEGDLDQGATDMALIKLNKKVTDVPHYRLRDFPLPEEGDEALLVGYGADEFGGSGVQLMGETDILSVSATLIQTGGEGNAGICPGDSGGPVFTRQDEEWVVSAVNSFGVDTGTCDPAAGAYSVNTLGACHWLNKNMIELVGHDLGLESCSLCEIEPVGIWGRGCGPGLPDCPHGTTCHKPADYSSGGFGYCAAPCCEIGEEEPERCFDVADGEERCDMRDGEGGDFCVVYCEDDADCPNFTECKQKPFGTTSICIATKNTVEDDIDTDTDTLYEPKPDGGADGDADADAGGDGDADADGDADGDVDAGLDAGDGSGDDAGCGCRHTGTRVSFFSLLAALTSLLS